MRNLRLTFVLCSKYLVPLPVKSKVKISQDFVAFSEYMNYTKICNEPGINLRNLFNWANISKKGTNNNYPENNPPKEMMFRIVFCIFVFGARFELK